MIKYFKNNISLNIFLASLAFVLFSCQKGKVDKDKIIELSISNSYNSIENLFLDSGIDNFEFIPLETKQECLLSSMLNLIVDNKAFYILDSHLRKKIFAFDLNGNFRRSVGELGKGEREYIKIYDFDICDNTLMALVWKGKSLMYYYDINTLEYITQKHIPDNLTAISVKSFDMKDFLYYNGGIDKINFNRFNLVYYNEFNNIQKGLLKNNHDIPPIHAISITKDVQNKNYYFWDAIFCKIYEVTPNSVREVIKISDAKFQLEKIKCNNDLVDFFSKKYSFHIVSCYAQNSNNCYLLLTKEDKGERHFFHLFYNFQNGRLKVFSDISTKEPSIQAPFYFENNLYFIASASLASKISNKNISFESDNPYILKININDKN